MTRLCWALFLAGCAARCVVACLAHGYGLRRALAWTWDSHRALWAITTGSARVGPERAAGAVRGMASTVDGVVGQ